MKKIKFSFLLVIATIITASFTSCNNDNNPDGNGGDNTTKTFLPSKITLNDSTQNLVMTFAYDSQNHLTEMNETVDNRNYKIIYKYDAQGKLILLVDSKTRYDKNNNVTETSADSTTFAYEGTDKVIATYIDREYGNMTYTMQLNSAGRITELTQLYESDTYTDTFEYDANGNVTKIDGTGSKSEYLTYDSKKGIFSQVNMPSWLFMYDFNSFEAYLINNVLKIKYSEGDSYTNTTTYEYTYNENGFPKTLRFFDENDKEEDKLIYMIEYIQK